VNGIIIYEGNGIAEFNGTLFLSLCGNLSTDTYNFINATIFLELSNGACDVFLVDDFLEYFYVKIFEKTIYNQGFIKINSFGLTKVNYSLTSYYDMKINNGDDLLTYKIILTIVVSMCIIMVICMIIVNSIKDRLYYKQNEAKSQLKL
jgi:hypothetical protein